jgi:acyl-CoA synthetase (AMP-forming)/AMP-acid ligase II
MNLMMLLEMAASSFPERVAVQNGEDRLTFAELFSAAGAAADEIARSGTKHVATLDVSSLALPVGLFAAAWAGVPFVPLNYRLTDAELDRLMSQIEPAYLVTDTERVPTLAGRAGATVVSREDFLASARGGSAQDGTWPMEPDDIAILLFTSGTTGPPKAAVLRQKHVVSYILGAVEFGSAAETDASLVSVPPYHIAGISALASSIYSGRRIVQLPNFSAEAWIDLARRERVTYAFVVPTMLQRIVEVLEGAASADLPHLRAISYGGGKMPLSVIERAMRLFPEADFANAYGLTETSATLTVLGPDDHRSAAASEDPAVRRRLTSVGRVRGWAATASSPRVTAAGSTRRATSSSRDGSTTSSCAAVRTCHRVRSRTFCSSTKRWRTARSWASRTSAGERRSRQSSLRSPAARSPPMRSAISSSSISARRARPSASSSATSCPTARRGSCCAARCVPGSRMTRTPRE